MSEIVLFRVPHREHIHSVEVFSSSAGVGETVAGADETGAGALSAGVGIYPVEVGCIGLGICTAPETVFIMERFFLRKSGGFS